MSKDEIAELYRFMIERFDAIDKRLDNTATKQDIEDIRETLDALIDQKDIDATERAAIKAQLDRHEEQPGKIEHTLKAA